MSKVANVVGSLKKTNSTIKQQMSLEKNNYEDHK